MGRRRLCQEHPRPRKGTCKEPRGGDGLREVCSAIVSPLFHLFLIIRFLGGLGKLIFLFFKNGFSQWNGWNELWTIRAMEYCAALQRSELLSLAVTWMDLKSGVPSGGSQNRKSDWLSLHVYKILENANSSGVTESKLVT